MHVRAIRIQGYKRFSDLTVESIPTTAQLVVLAGPNGSGKSSLFDAFKYFHHMKAGGPSSGREPVYIIKQGLPPDESQCTVSVEFHESLPADHEGRLKLFYIRSAYRNEPDFTMTMLSRTGDILGAQQPARLIDNDTRVLDNYQRLVSASVDAIYRGNHDSLQVRELRELHVGQIRESMRRIFGDVVLAGLGDPLEQGSFFFDKGAAHGYHYKNLSGGEKAAFDLLLDFVVKRPAYDHTVYCIDEPELHMHTRLQRQLLREMLALLPDTCQLWIATHSIGMMREAKDMQEANPGSVAFLDFGGKDFDTPVMLVPARVNRAFWTRALEVSLDDMADLVAPQCVVLCEGLPKDPKLARNAEFDARCYRTIFDAGYPDTDFLSIGGSNEVESDRLGAAVSIQALASGTSVIRLVDRDSRTPQEIADLAGRGIRVLSRRSLESYLLDDEILKRLCTEMEQREKVPEVLAAKQGALSSSKARGNPPDDLKSAAGEILVAVRKILQAAQLGNTAEAFLRDTLAPLVPGTSVYEELRRDIFGK